MAKKFDGSILFKRMEEEKAAREEREAKAKIDWRKKLKLMPWQTLSTQENRPLCALDYIVTNDRRHYDFSDIPHFTSADFVKQIDDLIK